MAKWTDSAKWLLGGEKGAFGFGRDVIPELVGMGKLASEVFGQAQNMSGPKKVLGVATGILGTMGKNKMGFPSMSPLAMGAGAYGAYSGYRDSRASGNGVARSVFSGVSRGSNYAGMAQLASAGAGYFRATQVGAGLFRGAADASTLARGAAKTAFARKEAMGHTKLLDILTSSTI